MKKWFIADTHFSHANIIKYAGRPFATVEEMDRALIENWNKCVGEDDQVLFLSDFGLGDVARMNRIGFLLSWKEHFLKLVDITSNSFMYRPVRIHPIFNCMGMFMKKNQTSYY